jgi:hypothetical protein
MWSGGVRSLFVAMTLVWGAVLVPAVGCSQRNATEEEGQPSRLSGQEAVAPAPAQLVISQIYGGAPDDQSRRNRDFVELHNTTNSPAPLAGLSIHYSGSVSDFAPAGNLPKDVTLPPGGYYLVGFAAGEPGEDQMVDGTGIATVNLPPSNGKLAIVRDVPVADPDSADASVQLLGCGSADHPCDSPAAKARIVDLVGYGDTSAHEGAASAPAPSVMTMLRRKWGGCKDTGQNGDDFEVVCADAPRRAKDRPLVCDGHTPVDSGTISLAACSVPTIVPPGDDAGADGGDAGTWPVDGGTDGGQPPRPDAGGDGGSGYTWLGRDAGKDAAPPETPDSGTDPATAKPAADAGNSAKPNPYVPKHPEAGCSVSQANFGTTSGPSAPVYVLLGIAAVLASRRRRSARFAAAAGAAGLMGLGCSSTPADDTAGESSAIRPMHADELLGPIRFGETKEVDYTNTPKYRAFSFEAQANDQIQAIVVSNDATDPILWIADESFNTVTVAADVSVTDTTAAVQGRFLTKSGTYYLIFRETNSAPHASFTVSLRKLGELPQNCDPDGEGLVNPDCTTPPDVDPFSPASCEGAPLTAAAATAKFGTGLRLGGAKIYYRTRQCSVKNGSAPDCSPWVRAFSMDASLGSITPAPAPATNAWTVMPATSSRKVRIGFSLEPTAASQYCVDGPFTRLRGSDWRPLPDGSPGGCAAQTKAVVTDICFRFETAPIQVGSGNPDYYTEFGSVALANYR